MSCMEVMVQVTFAGERKRKERKKELISLDSTICINILLDMWWICMRRM